MSPSPTILLPHLPPKTLVGIDLITFTSTPNFHGIRDLPPGWHFLYTGTTESLSIRCGWWFHVGDSASSEDLDGTVISPNVGPEVMIWKWDANTESLAPMTAATDADRQEAMRYRANLGAVWQAGGLFQYRSRVPLSSLLARSHGPGRRAPETQRAHARDEVNEEEGRDDWNGLTDRLSPVVLTRIIGGPQLDVNGQPRWMLTSASTARQDSDDLSGLVDSAQASDGLAETIEREESVLSLLPVDLKKTWREGAVGRERTEGAQDRSWALGDLIDRLSETDGGGARSGEAQVLGELQFTFLMVLTLMNYSCLQQWKRLLELILTCQSAIKDREVFVRDVLRLLLLQLKRSDDVDGGLFDLDGEEGGKFLRKLLMKFRISLYEILDGVSPAVKAEFERLEAWVKNEYDWELNRVAFVRKGIVQLEDGEEVELEMNEDDEDDETGEYAPLVVDLGETTDIQS